MCFLPLGSLWSAQEEHQEVQIMDVTEIEAAAIVPILQGEAEVEETSKARYRYHGVDLICSTVKIYMLL